MIQKIWDNLPESAPYRTHFATYLERIADAGIRYARAERELNEARQWHLQAVEELARAEHREMGQWSEDEVEAARRKAGL